MNPKQESIYQIAQRGPPRLPGASVYLAGGIAAASNAQLNRDIREQAKQEAQPVLNAIYQSQQARAQEEEKQEDPVPGVDEPDVQDENVPLLNDQVNRIIEAQPPPPGVNIEQYRQFLNDAIDVGERIGKGTQIVGQLMSSAALTYHLWTERKFDSEVFPPGTSSGTSTSEENQKKIEEKISNPVPPQCFRHVYRDERGHLRTIVICKTEGHGQRFYHDM